MYYKHQLKNADRIEINIFVKLKYYFIQYVFIKILFLEDISPICGATINAPVLNFC